MNAIVTDARGSGIGRFSGIRAPVLKRKLHEEEEEIHPLEKIVEEVAVGATKIKAERAQKTSEEADAELVAIKKVRKDVADLLKEEGVEEDPQIEDEKLEEYVQNLMRKEE